MDKQKEIQFSLRKYFVRLFFIILVATSFIGVAVIFFLKNLLKIETSLTTWLLIFFGTIIVIGSLVMWWGSVYLTRPISDLNESVKSISKGNYNHKIYRRQYPKDTAKYHNEIDQLARNINQMAEDLKKSSQQRADFIANFSHELKTPIAALVGVSDLLADEKLDEATRRDLTHILQSESMRLSRLCDDIVTLTKMEKDFSPQKTKVQLDEQIRHAVILMTEKWKEKEIHLTFSSKPVYCRTDADLMMQVWTNLIDNAIKYSGDTVELNITILEENQQVKVLIEDKGIGLTPEAQRHIFEQFYQAEQSHVQEGNGLGLAIVQSIVHRLKGEISVESELGKGSVFEIILPIEDEIL